MKRVFTFFCALVLLLSCFSGMVVSAAEAEPVAPATTETQEVAPEITEVEAPKPSAAPAEEEPAAPAELPADVEMKAPELFPKQEVNAPKTYAAALTHRTLEAGLSDEFMDYLQLHFGNCESSFSIAKFKIAASQLDNLRYIIWYETPELFHVYSLGIGTSNGILTDIYVTYRPHSDTAAEYKTCLNKMLAGADYLLRGVKNNDNLTDLEKALILHDRLAVWVEYDLDNVRYNDGKLKIYAAYGALGEGLAVCQGYAMAYMYLLEQVGIESDLCSSEKINHSWNIVYIDGKPYYTDVTWDDPTNNWPTDKYFDNYGRVYHRNFMRSYAGIHSNHVASDYPQVSAPTTYDSGWWWSNSYTSIELFGNTMYYVDNTDGSIYQKNANGAVKVYQHSNPSNGAWILLSIAGYKLVIGDIWEIKTLDLSNGTVTRIWKAGNNDGYVEGLKYEKGKLYFQVCSEGVSSRYYLSDFRAESTIIGQPKDVIVGEGQMAKTTVQAVGDGLKYQWYIKNKGATTWGKSSLTGDTYYVNMTAAISGRQVYCVVTDQYGKTMQTKVVTLSMRGVQTALKITKQPKDVTVANGATVTVSLTATGDGLSYAWYYKNKGASSFTKSSFTTNTFSLTMTDAVDGRQVYCLVTDQYGNSIKSNVITLRQCVEAKFIRQPQDVYVDNGQQARTSVEAEGDGLTYAWYIKNPGTTYWAKSSLTGNSYYVTMTDAIDGRQVYCEITDAYGNKVQSNVATLHSKKYAKITKQPRDSYAATGETVRVSLEAEGDGLTYAWYYKPYGSKSFILSTKALSNRYSTTMSSSVNGRQVYCVVTDKYGNSVQSDTVTLILCDTITITQQPKDVFVGNGTKAETSVIAEGNGLTYTWYIKSPGATAWNKSSLTGNSYYVTMKESINGRQIYCLITDATGNQIATNVITLRSGNFAKITTQPKKAAAPNGHQVKTTVTATGDGLTYAWYIKSKGATAWNKSSLTGSSYYVAMKSTIDGRQVYCVITDKYGNSVKSDVVTLYMGNPAKITAQPKNAAAPNGQQVKTTMTATGDGLKYTWYIKNKGASSWGKSSLTGNSYYVAMNSNISGRQVYCVVTDKYGISVKSNVVTLYMGNPAKITKQPQNAAAMNGQQVKTTMTATGDGLKYTWYIKDKGASSWGKSSLTGNSYYVTMKDTINGRQIYCVVTDKYGTSVKSNVVTLSKMVFGITAQPTSVAVPNGSTAKTTIKAAGEGLKYTWYYKNKGASKFTKSSITGASYSVTMKSAVDGRQVYCVVSDKNGNSAKSNTITLRDSTKLLVDTWKATKHTFPNGSSGSFTKSTITIKSASKITLKFTANSDGYRTGTFTYKLKYDKMSGNTVYYKFTNNAQTLTVTYSFATNQLTVYIPYTDGSGSVGVVYNRT